MGKTELGVYSTFKGYLGNKPPQNNCSNCSKNCSKAGKLTDIENNTEPEALYPAGIKTEPEQKNITPDELEKLQNTPNSDGVLPLLPSEWNQTFKNPIQERKYADEPENTDDSKVLPLYPNLNI